MGTESDQAWDATRRGFLGVAAGLTGAMLLRPSSGAEAANVRSFTGGVFALELDKVPVGFLKSVDGGNATAEVVVEAPLSYYSKKHIANVKYEDFEIQAGFGLAKGFYDWIANTWTGNAPRHDGAIDGLDFKLNAVSSREFDDALITEVTIPACDGASKEPAYLTVKFSPELTRTVKGGGSSKDTLPIGQKAWLPSNFRLQIDALDTSKVSKIDAFTVKQTVVTGEIGDKRELFREPGTVEFPNLVITFSESTAATWNAWFEDFVIKGNSYDSKERMGTLEFLSNNRVDVLATIKFFNLGIFRLTHDKAESSSDTIRRMTAELYCERMEFFLKFPPPPSST